jgi:hypothetical protein
MRNIAVSLAIGFAIWVLIHESYECLPGQDYGRSPDIKEIAPPAKGGLAPPLKNSDN